MAGDEQFVIRLKKLRLSPEKQIVGSILRKMRHGENSMDKNSC